MNKRWYKKKQKHFRQKRRFLSKKVKPGAGTIKLYTIPTQSSKLARLSQPDKERFDHGLSLHEPRL